MRKNVEGSEDKILWLEGSIKQSEDKVQTSKDKIKDLKIRSMSPKTKKNIR